VVVENRAGASGVVGTAAAWHRIGPCPFLTLTVLVYPGSHDLNFSNRPVGTRMPGDVGGARSGILTAPIPIDCMAMSEGRTAVARYPTRRAQWAELLCRHIPER
jgi:hypothetical protein